MLGIMSCEDSSTAGGSLVQDEVEIVMDSAFSVEGRPVTNDLVQSRTILQLLGSIEAEGYGLLSSDIVCQYMPASNIDTFGVKAEYIDSVRLEMCMYKDAFAGDSTVPMGLTVYMLDKQLPSPIYSNFDPTGYYDPSKPVGSVTYSALLDGSPELAKDDNGNLYKSINVKLPRQLGVDLYNLFLNSPQTLQTPQAFAKWFPGLYIANSFGSGRVTRINNNYINVYYHSVHKINDDKNPRDTTLYHVSSYMAVTPEIITNNNIHFEMSDALEDRADDGETILVGPTGYDVEFIFPTREILQRYQQSGPLSVVNALNFTIPAKDISNDYGLKPPPYILMVKKSQKDKFFASTQINDNMSSFYAAYNSLTKSYTFSSMRNYIIDIINKGSVTADDEEFVICPVQVSFYTNSNSNYYYGYYYGSSSSTSTQVSTITPYVTEPVMTILDLKHAKIDFTFSKQTIGN